MKKVLVLCHANVNRSPLCAALLAKVGGIRVKVTQAALNPNHKSQRAAKKIRDAGMEMGLNLEDHRSQQVTCEMVEDADLVIYMDGGNLKRLQKLMEHRTLYYPSKSRCLGEFADPPVSRIPDPGFQRRGSDEFHNTVTLILQASLNLVKMIAQPGGERQDEGQRSNP